MGERNIKLEQTTLIYALCSGTGMVKIVDCSVVVSHYIHQLECRTLKAPRAQTHTEQPGIRGRGKALGQTHQAATQKANNSGLCFGYVIS